MTKIVLRKNSQLPFLDGSEYSDDESSDVMGDSESGGLITGGGGVRHNKFSQSKFFKKLGLCSFVLLFFGFLYIPLSSNMHPRIVPIAGWNYNTSRETIEYVIPNSNTTLIDPTHICGGEIFFLLIVVCSSAGNFDARQSIRETWGSLDEFNHPMFYKMHSHFVGQYLDIKYKEWHKYATQMPPIEKFVLNTTNPMHYKTFSVKIVFLIGQTLNNDTQTKIYDESDTYRDIIQESFVDSYNNLTLKSVMMLKWVTNNCLDKVKFLMKCDDDIFLNIPNLLHVLLGGTVPLYNASITLFDQQSVRVKSSDTRLRNPESLLLGFLFCNAKPIADVTSKWYSPVYMYSGEEYPNYLSGTGYVMSVRNVAALYNASLITPLFHLEDIYVTGICANKIKLRPHHNPLFYYSHIANACVFKSMITQHHISPELNRKAYEFVINATIHCPAPKKFSGKRRKKSCHTKKNGICQFSAQHATKSIKTLDIQIE